MKGWVWLALLTVGLLGGCAFNGGDRPVATTFDFGLPATGGAVATPSKPAWGNVRLAIEVTAPSWFDALGVDYRLAYDNPLKQREYVGSRWAGSPGVLLAQRLAQRLGVPESAGGVSSDCLVRFELQEFSQVFDTPQASRGVLLGRANLIDLRHQPLLTIPMQIERTATTPDAAGGVRALVDASDELGDRLAAWLGDLSANGTLARCRPPATAPASTKGVSR